MAAAYSLFAIVVALAQGSIAFSQYGRDLAQILTSYLVAGLVGGAIVGLLRPFNSTVIGSAITGFIASFSVFLAMNTLLAGNPSRWPEGEWWTVLVISIIAGPLVGMYLRDKPA